MAKQGVRAEVNTFVQGLITEASPLNFPANASVDEDNFELNRDGTRDRRLGIDLEDGYAYRSISAVPSSISTAGINTYKWKSVNGNDGEEFIVVQVNKVLQFCDASASSLSGSGYLSAIELSSFPEGVTYSLTSLEGKLVVAAGVDTIAVVSHSAGSFSVEYLRLKVRDQWGIAQEGTGYERDKLYRDGSLYLTHYYNLQNQSWGVPRKDKNGLLKDPISLYYDEYKVYPSNSETVWAGLQYQPIVNGGDPFERVYPNLYQEVFGADVEAPKGYYIIDLLRRGQSRVDAFADNYNKSVTYDKGREAVYGPPIGRVDADGNYYYEPDLLSPAIPEGWTPKLIYPTLFTKADYTPGGASVVAEFAGRVFYAGFSGDVIDGDSRSPCLVNYVAFSQLVKSTTDITKCYQEGDPTSRENSDLVDTDGGLIRISGADKIIAIKNINTHLVVIATNGVWTISGGSDYGFSATNYKVAKISAYGGIASSSIVEDGEQCYFWAEDGIYVIGRNQFGDLEVKNITQSTIQKYYDQIPINAKYSCVGVYDLYNKKVRWLFKQGEMFTATSVTKELILDTLLGAFYTHTIGRTNANDVEVVGMAIGSTFRRADVFEGIVAGTEAVYAGTDQVGVSTAVRFSGIQSVRYLTVKVDSSVSYTTFALYKNSKFLDWETVDGVGVDAKAYLLTGALTGGDSAIAKQAPYLVMHFRRTELTSDNEGVPQNQSSCKVRTQWEWANSPASKKWSSSFQAYRLRRHMFAEEPGGEYDTGFETVITKNHLRGRGKALALYMETEAGKDCRILGWNLTLNGNRLA